MKLQPLIVKRQIKGYTDSQSARECGSITFGTNLARGGVASRVAMALMRHSDRRLTDKVYTDENLLGNWGAIDSLPNYAKAASPIAYLF